MGKEEEIRNVHHISRPSKPNQTSGSVEAAPLKGMLEREEKQKQGYGNQGWGKIPKKSMVD